MRVSLTTPRGSLTEADFDEVTAPGVLGEFGILPGHVPFLSALRPGVLVLRSKDDARVFAVGDGILEVVRSAEGERILILVDQALTAGEIDKSAASEKMAAADKELADWHKEQGGEYKATLSRRAFAAAQVEAAARANAH